MKAENKFPILYLVDDMEILTTTGLTKEYNTVRAVDNLNLHIQGGEVFGFLGPNGSGKTTTLGICTGIIHPTSGSFDWFEGKYGDDYRRHIGTLLETPNFYTYLSAWDNLKIVQMQKQSFDDNLDEILELVGLHARRHSRFRTFSLGMKQRLAIGAALIGSPEVLIFDEPTNGLDPAGIAEIRRIILDIAAMDKSIIMASHILDEVEKVCSHVGIIKQGKLIAHGKVGAILGDENLVEIAASDLTQLKKALVEIDFIMEIEEKDTHFILTLPDEVQTETLNKRLVENGIYVSRLNKVHRRLEDEFLTLTNKA